MKDYDYYQIDFKDEVVNNFISQRLSLQNYKLKKGYYFGTEDEEEYDIYLDGINIGLYQSGFDEPGIHIRDIEAINQFLVELNDIKPIKNFDPETPIYLKVHDLMHYLYDSDYYLKYVAKYYYL